MNRMSPMPRRRLLVAAVLIGSRLAGQIAPPSSSSVDEADAPVVLSPFVVQAEEDAGYAARATLAGTRIRTELKDVGSSISVVTKKFLDDTQSNKAEQLLVYTPSTEVAGQGGNFLGKSDAKYLTGIEQSLNATTRVRGLASADNTRDFFLTDIPWDSYNTGRIDLQRGPNSILFGIGSPAGIINSSPNPASFKNSRRIEVQLGSYDSRRFSADLNQVLVPGELAVRLSLLRDDTKYRQEPAFRDDHRIYGAVRWDPGFLNRGSAHTSMRVSYEDGRIEANQPRNTPPLDALTPWYTTLNREVFDPNKVDLGLRSSRPGLDGIGGNTSHAAFLMMAPDGRQLGSFLSPHSDVPTELYFMPIAVGTSDTVAIRAKYPGYTIDAWKAKSLTDPSVFDFYHQLLEGPNNRQFTEFTAFNAAIEQRFFQDRVGFELAYDRQEVYSGGYNYFNDARSAALSVDIMTELPFGAENPNLRRPLFGSHGGYGSWSQRTREVWRGTAFAELNFADLAGKDAMVARIFGRNSFTGLGSRQEVEGQFASYTGYLANQPAFISIDADDDIHTADFYRDDVFFLNYLGGPITASAPSGLHIGRLTGRVAPGVNTSTVLAYNYATGQPQSIALPLINNVDASDRTKVYDGGSKTWERVDSRAFVWQGYWLDGTVIPMFGYRTDQQKARNAGGPPSYGFQDLYRDVYDADWVIPDEGPSTKVNSRTYSVVTHLPNRWRDRLPGRLDVSLIYNQSENIQPGAGRSDVLGNQVPDPIGKTKEYGIAISGFDDRVTLKVTKYDTTVKNAYAGDAIAEEYQYLVFTDSWGQWGAYAFRDHAGDPAFFQSSTIYGQSSDGHPVTWLPDGPPKGHRDGAGAVVFDYTQAELDATWAKEKASIEDWFRPENQLPQAVVDHWELGDYHNPASGFPRGTIPGGLQVTADTMSKGYEIELIANPIKGLNVSLNASKVSAKRTNLASSFVDFIEQRWEVFQGPAGDMRFWGISDPVLGGLNGNPDRDSPEAAGQVLDGWSARGHFRRSVMSGYWLFRALEGADVPELKPWAFSGVADYAFQSGPLKGFNVGGSYRWHSANVTGFPVLTDADGVEYYDVDHPYRGSTEGIADAWIGYTRSLGKKVRWRTQLNVRYLLANDHLIRVTVNPDGGPAGYRIPEPRTITWTNTLEF